MISGGAGGRGDGTEGREGRKTRWRTGDVNVGAKWRGSRRVNKYTIRSVEVLKAKSGLLMIPLRVSISHRNRGQEEASVATRRYPTGRESGN